MLRRTLALTLGGALLTAAAVMPAAAAPAEKVTICHFTGSETNPYVVITISENALSKHFENHGHRGEDRLYDGSECGTAPIGEETGG